MRWNVKPKPVIGDKRTITKFAWFPVRIGSVMVWMETYTCKQMCVREYKTLLPIWEDKEYELKEAP